jgi:16S rRNA (cytosine967-C5)-methyltransferase
MALEILRRVERSGAFASLLLQHLGGSMPPEEARLATELVYGSLRFRLRDEHLLSVLAGRPVSAVDPEIALLFRIAAHQILRLDRVPDHAAVNEAVAAAKRLGGRDRQAAARRVGGARFLNAVLRRLCAEKGSLPLPVLPGPGAGAEEWAAALEVHHSHPRWLIRRWIDRFGLEGTVELLEVNNRPAPVTLRVDTAHATPGEAAEALAGEGIITEESPVAPGFLRVLKGASQRAETFRRGWIYIQDEASGLIPGLVAPAPGARVLDACAAPGGKTLALARKVGPEGFVVAADRHASRVGLIRANARRMRVPNVRLVVADMTSPPLAAAFDAVLVDAPCSGSGVFRRDVESRYRLTPSDLEMLARRQRELLAGVGPFVRPGGRLVYAVCSLEPEEGEEAVAAFLEEHREFERIDLLAEIPARADLVGDDGAFRTLPHVHDMDGFYAAALARK